MMTDEIVLRGTEYLEDIPLTDRQKVFVEEYAINGFNALAAAKAAGYKWAHKFAYRLVRDPKVRAAIEARFKDRIMTADEVLARLTEQARGDYGNYIDSEGEVDIEALKADGKAHLIKSISDSKYGKRIEFYDSQKAISLMAKYHRLFADRVENIHFDMSRLSDRQLERLSGGAKLIDVLLDRESYDSSDVVEGASRVVEAEEESPTDAIPEIPGEVQE
jgi:phage terminase small subunit